MCSLIFLLNKCLLIVSQSKVDTSQTSQSTDGIFDGMDDDEMLISASNQQSADVNGDIDFDDENSIDIGTIKKGYNFGEDEDDGGGLFILSLFTISHTKFNHYFLAQERHLA